MLKIMFLTFRLGGGCPDGMSCDYAHSPEELQEWVERRTFLRQKLAKAREDMLIMPDEFDFGKYNFLLQDWEYSDFEPFVLTAKGNSVIVLFCLFNLKPKS